MDIFDEWLTIDELANYIKMSLTKLYGMARQGGAGVMAGRQAIHTAQPAEIPPRRQRPPVAFSYMAMDNLGMTAWHWTTPH